MDESSASGRMNHYEKGRHVPDVETLRKIAAELNVPLNYFFCEDELTAELACLISKLDDDTVTVRFMGDKGGKFMATKFGATTMNCLKHYHPITCRPVDSE